MIPRNFLNRSRAGLLVFIPLIAWVVGENRRLAADDGPVQSEAVVLSETSRVVRAANAFLSTLDPKQRARVLFAFDDKVQRARWSNFPTGFVPRGGISLQELNDDQRAAALALVASVLSPEGYEKVQQIMAADEVFKLSDHGRPPFGNDKDHAPGGPPFGDDKDHRDGPPFGDDKGNQHGGPPPDLKPGEHGGPLPGGFPPGGGGDAMFGKDLYFLSILGAPSEKEPWMLQYGGHHLALNITIAGERGVLTPTLTGAQPATYIVNGKTVRPLGQENDNAFALLNALEDTQRKQAVLNYRVADLVLGPGHDGETIQPEGLKVSTMNEAQRALLLDLISKWAGIVNDRYASSRMAEIKADLDHTWFAWSGPTTVEPGKYGMSYYRIQGPKLVIEYAPQHEEDHIHTMYRDPTNDYGRTLTATAR